ncbi:hypothetical protein HDV03_005110 [Kappamyces sp. JEL0829]|nr:hypothetical protein HDV03_005110 [Kappamyces sp. JEL0829]
MSPLTLMAVTFNSDLFAAGCDFVGQDLANYNVLSGDCPSLCVNVDTCTHWSWTPYQNGTCWLKSGPASASTAVASSTAGIMCGLLPPSRTTTPPRPVGYPPTTAPNGLLSMPLYYCTTAKSCSWKSTSLIIDGPSKNYATADVHAYPGGMSLSMNNGGSRLYLVDDSGASYRPIDLKNRMFSFDVDVSQVSCGYNAALYLVSMNKLAAIGTGYCDAQGTCSEFDIFEANIAATQITSHSCQGQPVNCDNWGIEWSAHD